MSNYHSIKWIDDKKVLCLLDQSILPHKIEYQYYSSPEGVAGAIKDMVVRGAPAIGVAAAYGLVVAAFHTNSDDITHVEQSVLAADKLLRLSRPTAVNLFWALDEMAKSIEGSTYNNADDYRQLLLQAAHGLAASDVEINKGIAKHAMSLMPEESVNFIHHCNTGALATVDYGTALGIIRMAYETGLNTHVFVDETRPRLQGAKLTSWELKQLGISHQLVVDGASAHIMSNFDIDMCVVGCDRVAANGDVANKIGTHNLAIIANAYNVPFYVAAPLSTIDTKTLKGEDIEIEQRDTQEVTLINGGAISPNGIEVYNPAFDVTPARYITAIITEKGILYPPFEENIKKLKASQ
ncbi:S-methyl-5-thioribose-1-phosphate isomerase [Agarilytica rhodophyticola]|uniref:S-methyl-5-thioribose-1-phosphate isomerase n=1 Tax=Agarilytica rhodophyticola TaxID=1737490 RepID=UPI000B340F0E|nr:S-methyl-5-thioribose-1-phosphate isomerase [Agarilytica rhodophyticola]